MEEELVALKYTDDREVAAELLARYDFIAVPVLDEAGGMVGIVTHDDIIDVIQEEATEDLQRQAAVGPIEGSYLEAGFGTVWYNRVKWLAVLFVLQMGTIYVMAYYEKEIAISAALVACLPLVLSVGGNAGSQAATLVVRALALDQVKPREWLRVLGRELLMGAALAGTLGVLALVRTYLWTPGSLLDRAARRARQADVRPRAGRRRHLPVGDVARVDAAAADPPTRGRPGPRLQPGHRHPQRRVRDRHLRHRGGRVLLLTRRLDVGREVDVRVRSPERARRLLERYLRYAGVRQEPSLLRHPSNLPDIIGRRSRRPGFRPGFG